MEENLDYLQNHKEKKMADKTVSKSSQESINFFNYALTKIDKDYEQTAEKIALWVKGLPEEERISFKEPIAQLMNRCAVSHQSISLQEPKTPEAQMFTMTKEILEKHIGTAISDPMTFMVMMYRYESKILPAHIIGDCSLLDFRFFQIGKYGGSDEAFQKLEPFVVQYLLGYTPQLTELFNDLDIIDLVTSKEFNKQLSNKNTIILKNFIKGFKGPAKTALRKDPRCAQIFHLCQAYTLHEHPQLIPFFCEALQVSCKITSDFFQTPCLNPNGLYNQFKMAILRQFPKEGKELYIKFVDSLESKIINIFQPEPKKYPSMLDLSILSDSPTLKKTSILYATAVRFLHGNCPNVAKEYFLSVLSHPQNSELTKGNVNLQLAFLLFQKGEYNEALERIQNAIEIFGPLFVSECYEKAKAQSFAKSNPIFKNFEEIPKEKITSKSKIGMSSDISLLFSQLEGLELNSSLEAEEVWDFIKTLKEKSNESSLPESSHIFSHLYIRAHNLLQKAEKAISYTDHLAGNKIIGSYNQFHPAKSNGELWPEGSSQSSCTINALMFLSYVLPLSSMTTWQCESNGVESGGNKIDKVVDEGRQRFDLIAKRKREEYHKLLEEAKVINDKETFEFLKFEQAGDALHVSEVPRLEETFFLTQDKVFDTLPLEKDVGLNTTTKFFKSLLNRIECAFEEKTLRSLGVVIHCNGSSYSLALLKKETCFEYVVFDSHGCKRVIGSSHAFTYWTENLEEASVFLGHLILFSDVDLGSLDSSMLNQVAAYCFRALYWTKNYS
ncbi:MAG: hypothetical protein KDK71_08760 [Chlamydiia bacterium]|nr:hypothetical protein [Chlamydiia bacterium]